MDIHRKYCLITCRGISLTATQVEGVITCLVALPTFFLLPSFPNETTMFKGEDKDVLLERLRRDETEEQESGNIKTQVLQALLDWKVWLA